MLDKQASIPYRSTKYGHWTTLCFSEGLRETCVWKRYSGNFQLGRKRKLAKITFRKFNLHKCTINDTISAIFF